MMLQNAPNVFKTPKETEHKVNVVVKKEEGRAGKSDAPKMHKEEARAFESVLEGSWDELTVNLPYGLDG